MAKKKKVTVWIVGAFDGKMLLDFGQDGDVGRLRIMP